VYLSSSVCVRALKEKRLELPTPNFMDMQCMAVARHPSDPRSTDQKVKSQDYGSLNALPAWVCMSVGLSRFIGRL